MYMIPKHVADKLGVGSNLMRQLNDIEPRQDHPCNGTMTDDELMEAWRRGETVDESRVNEILGKYCGRGPCWLEGGP